MDQLSALMSKEGIQVLVMWEIKPGGDIFQVAQDAGAGGLAFIRVKDNDIDTIGAIKNNLDEPLIKQLLQKTSAEEGDLILLGAGKTEIVNQSLDRVRQYIAKELDLVDDVSTNKKWNFLWITDFPMFAKNEEENRLEALHHPFLSLIHIWRCRRLDTCRSRWSPYH